MREEGGIKLIIILVWMNNSTGMSLLGRKILGENKLGSSGVGMPPLLCEVNSIRDELFHSEFFWQ